jgi:hypothetical protein
MLIYGADHAALARVLDRALARGVQPALYTEEMFLTTHDAANRNAVCGVEREDLNLVGIAIRAEVLWYSDIVSRCKHARRASVTYARSSHIMEVASLHSPRVRRTIQTINEGRLSLPSGET